jgi:hypothetical protein
MAFADVVSFVAVTKRISVAAYGTPTTSVRQLHPRLALGTINNSAGTAIADLRLATCHPLSSVALIAAPPVEKSAAAARSWRRAEVVLTMTNQLVAGQRTVRTASNFNCHPEGA